MARPAGCVLPGVALARALLPPPAAGEPRVRSPARHAQEGRGQTARGQRAPAALALPAPAQTAPVARPGLRHEVGSCGHLVRLLTRRSSSARAIMAIPRKTDRPGPVAWPGGLARWPGPVAWPGGLARWPGPVAWQPARGPAGLGSPAGAAPI